MYETSINAISRPMQARGPDPNGMNEPFVLPAPGFSHLSGLKSAQSAP